MVTFSIKKFDVLTRNELHDLFALRAAVFVVEQDCVYQDIDGKDQDAYHVLGKQGDKLVAYARLLKKGVSYTDFVAIGRVVVADAHRGKSVGHNLFRFCLQELNERYPKDAIKISAQAHLEQFYKQHGFQKTGAPYLEDGIPHIGMIKNQTKH